MRTKSPKVEVEFSVVKSSSGIFALSAITNELSISLELSVLVIEVLSISSKVSFSCESVEAAKIDKVNKHTKHNEKNFLYCSFVLISFLPKTKKTMMF
ncbi:MAG: hypothetical protein BKP49_01265 [Treponema sp. CETP13]|nr:MAG: hypothetical protein BKP49_01265 [Treponema sp. CETP13]